MACRCKPRSSGSDTHRRTAHTTEVVADRSGVSEEPAARETLGIQCRENERKTLEPGDDRVSSIQCPECEGGGFVRGAVWFEFVCEECGLAVEAREMEHLGGPPAEGRAEPAPRMAECGERAEG